LRPTVLAGASAARLPDRTLFIAQGKLIDCVLETAINTDVAGMTRCTISADVVGDDGKAVVLDRGTELTGEYRSNVRTGQARLGIVWTRAKTPSGVIIELDSPATDSLGRAGVEGYVDNHFWQRYGAAILFSSLDDSMAFLTARASRNQIFVPTNTTSTGTQAASVALGANVNIPPTIVKNQGELVKVFVARDLDFRSVYAYRAPPVASNE
jgi:type IV secretion system protein VirB10